MQLNSWIEQFVVGKEPKKKDGLGYVYYLGTEDKNKFTSLAEEHGLSWQLADLKKNEREMVLFTGQKGPVCIIRPKRKSGTAGHGGLIDESDYAFSRDLFGTVFTSFKAHAVQQLRIEFIGTEPTQELGSLVGLEMATYNFRQVFDKKETTWPQVYLLKTLGSFEKDLLERAQVRAKAVNVSRHLVNLPPNELNPKTFVEFARKVLPKNMKITVWDEKKLEEEGMGLHLGVGRGAEFGPRLLQIRYRPTAAKSKKLKPIAFVGKGITFDTGGLDIKPSAAMRLMKKDMGGAASVLGMALWVAESGYQAPVDFYIALAENAIDAKSFRPSDIWVARNGLKVEIDNTDAEGRLVLADALDVAVTQKGADEPEIVIDFATLTGAIKVGLGVDIAGLFCNDDTLANELTQAGQRSGELNWRMPLFEKYMGDLSSPFADMKNSGGSFGGAITAALFLQRFVRGKKWAHLDIYAWTDKAQGALLGQGGNGQPVQSLIEYLESRV